MAQIKAVVLPSKTIKGGRNKVRISVAHNGETRYIVTDIVLNSNKEFKNGSVVKRPDAAMLNTKIRNLLQKYQSVLDELQYINGLTAPELVFQLVNISYDKHRTLNSIFEEYIDFARIKDSTKVEYATQWKAIIRHVGENILAEHITRSTILHLDKHLGKRLAPTSVRGYMTLLSVILNYAKRCGYANYRVDPFSGYKKPAAVIRDAWLTVDEIKRIRDAEIQDYNVRKCRDIFMLSYYLGGINITDLLDINFRESGSRIKYERKKTEARSKINKYVEFDIPSEAWEIISMYQGADGKIATKRNQRNNRFQDFFKRYLPRVAEAAAVKKIIYYSARKSFSQHAFNLGVRESVIDYILGHKVGRSGASLYFYLTVTPEIATKAIRKVLDNLR